MFCGWFTRSVPENFQGYKEALQGVDNYFPNNVPDNIDNGNAIHFSGVYKTNGNTKHINTMGRFDYRIDVALSMMKQELEDEFSGESVCFFSVKAKHIESKKSLGKKPKPKFRIAQIIAIYFDGSTQIPDKNFIDAHRVCERLFEESKQIRKIDNELFELEGHELTSRLQPLFLDKDIAPSDKIAFAIERLKKLINRHLESHYPSTQGNKTEVYFISLAYEILDKDKPKELFPIFQVYPHVYRREFPYGAFIIGHPQFVSISKYLLRNYFKYYKEEGSMGFVVGSDIHNSNPEIIISDVFITNLFKRIDSKIKNKGCTEEFSETPDQVFISKHFEDSPKDCTNYIWNELNVDIRIGTEEANDKTNSSILAYVVEGHEIDQHRQTTASYTYQQLPRAILAIEGNQPEFLSAQERSSLRVLAQAFSNLVRHLFHDNTLLDYRLQLSSAYNGYSDAIKEGSNNKTIANRFILASMSVDVSLLAEIMEITKIDDRVSKDVIKKMETIFDEVFSGTEIEDGLVDDEEIVRTKINQRFERATNFIRRSNTAPSQDVVDLLEACPRNFAWAGYAPSLAQALGDRADHSPPEFELMTPGFSATGLYMALVESEIRQVAKLSSVSKLKKERNNYKKYVRYKVFVAARSPSNAFAFDSTGECGMSCGYKRDSFRAGKNYDKKCYGVLVSDLAPANNLDITKINGKNEQVDTFLEQITRLIVSPRKDAAERVVRSIINLFENNLGYWFRTPKKKDLGGLTTLDILHKCFRLNYKNKLKDSKPQIKLKPEETWTQTAFRHLMEGTNCHAKNIFPFIRHSLAPEKLAQFINYSYENRLGLADTSNCEDLLLSIVHGDLNSRNLVWAGPIDNLMLIDFEHVDIGFWGMDQARLATNTVVDFFSEIKLFSDGRLETVAKAVENGAEFIVNVWIKYNEAHIERDCSKLLNYFEKFEDGETSWKEEADKILKSIVQWVIRTTWHFNKELLDVQFLGILQACLSFSVVKEYEYSITNIRRLDLNEAQISSVNEITKNHNRLKKQLVKLYKSDEFDCISPQGKDELATISKYLISHWILRKIFNEIKFVNTDYNEPN